MTLIAHHASKFEAGRPSDISREGSEARSRWTTRTTHPNVDLEQDGDRDSS